MIKIKTLSKKYLEQASRLADEIFTTDPIFKYDHCIPSNYYKARINKKTPPKSWQGIELAAIYVVAVDEKNDVIGNCGLYTVDKDEKEADWLSWFCVKENCRRQGTGTALLDWAIGRSKKRGKKFLRLYTSDSKNEIAAQKLYQKKEFVLRPNSKRNAGKNKIFERQLKL